MNTDEINRLLRITSEPLRSSWEILNLNSQSLIDLGKSRLRMIKENETANKKINFLTVATLPLAVVCGSMWASWLLGAEKHHTIVIVSAFASLLGVFVALWMMKYYIDSIEKRKTLIDVYDEDFQKFGKSVDDLNPLGIGNTYHDVITLEVVRSRAVDLAAKVVDAEARFDKARGNTRVARWDLVHTGQWVDKCQGWLDTFWQSATKDFGVELDKATVFAKAGRELAKTENKPV